MPERQRLSVLRWAIVSAAMFVLLLTGCSSQPGVKVSAVCYPDTDPSMDITKPTIFADLTLSSRTENVPRVPIAMLDAAGHEIGNAEAVAGYVFPGDTKVVTVPVGIPKGGIRILYRISCRLRRQPSSLIADP